MGGQPGGKMKPDCLTRSWKCFTWQRMELGGTAGPIFPYGKGEGGEEEAHPPVETQGTVWGPLLGAPETTIFLQWRGILPRWSGPGKCAQPGGLSQLAGENERASLPHLFQHRDPRGLSEPLPGGPSSLSPSEPEPEGFSLAALLGPR